VSDADRDAALSELGEHFQAGRLTAAELDERAGRAISARTGKDLADLMTDLPTASTALQRTGSGTDVRADAGDAGPRRRSGLWTPITAVVALAGIWLVLATLIGMAHGHGQGNLVPWWLIPVGLLVFRALNSGSSRRRAHGGE
jgi:hypothetical protein